MTTTPAIARHRAPMPFHRKTSLAAGALYLLTFVSIPTFALYSQIRTDQNYVAGGGADTLVVLGGVLEVIVALACIGTGVALYPIVKRQNEGVALGFVAARILEAAAISPASSRSCRSSHSAKRVSVKEVSRGSGSARPEHLDDAPRPRADPGHQRVPARFPHVPVTVAATNPSVFGFIGAPVLIVGVAGTLLASGGLFRPCPELLHCASACGSMFGMGVWLVVKGFNPVAVAKLTAASGDVATSAVRRTLVSHSRAGTE